MKIFRLLRVQELIYNRKERRLAAAIKMIVGRKPLNLSLYKLALKHASAAEDVGNGVKASNERLEFLGDAVLGTIIAEHLFLKFPYRDEGFLTETRSRIVNRESLNQIGLKLGLGKIVESELSEKGMYMHKSLFGDALEALVGAVYLDRGYAFTKEFVYTRILTHFDIEHIISTTINFKSKIIEWAQKNNHVLEFNLAGVQGNQRFKEFTVNLTLNQEQVSEGKGPTKKKAEQEAAKTACEKLKL
ncbi:ribonuclease III [Litoribacter ruber]|nr:MULTISPECIES: ribonuclease III [Litoribacter]